MVGLIGFITCSPTEPEKEPKLSVDPTSVAFTKDANSDILVISNSGDGELSWEINDKPDWLEVSISSGKVTSGKDTVIITANINQAAGTYSGTININSNGGNQVVNISLNITVWIKKKDMPTARWGLSVSGVNGKIYAMGGATFINEPVLPTVEEFDPVTNIWTTKTNMPTARNTLCSSVVNGKIYTFGGSTDTGDTSVVEVYDPTTDEWIKKTNMLTARSAAGSVVVNGKIYVIGGGVEDPELRALSVNEEYDPITDTWREKSDMPTARWGMAVSEVDGIIYVIGGQSSGGGFSRTLEAYNPSTNEWTRFDTFLYGMPTGRTHFCACTVNGIIYAIGGATTQAEVLSTVEAFDPVTKNWITKTDMPTPRHAFHMDVAEGKIYVIGGAGKGWPPIDILSAVEEYDPSIDSN